MMNKENNAQVIAYKNNRSNKKLVVVAGLGLLGGSIADSRPVAKGYDGISLQKDSNYEERCTGRRFCRYKRTNH